MNAIRNHKKQALSDGVGFIVNEADPDDMRNVVNSVPASDASASESLKSFEKKLDFSSFATGVTIPVAKRHLFLSNLSKPLSREAIQVTFFVQEKTYSAYVRNVASSGKNDCVMFLWTKPLAQRIQSEFYDVFTMLKIDRKKRRKEVFDTLIISCGDRPDEFKLDFSRKTGDSQHALKSSDNVPFVGKTLSTNNRASIKVVTPNAHLNINPKEEKRLPQKQTVPFIRKTIGELFVFNTDMQDISDFHFSSDVTEKLKRGVFYSFESISLIETTTVEYFIVLLGNCFVDFWQTLINCSQKTKEQTFIIENSSFSIECKKIDQYVFPYTLFQQEEALMLNRNGIHTWQGYVKYIASPHSIEDAEGIVISYMHSQYFPALHTLLSIWDSLIQTDPMEVLFSWAVQRDLKIYRLRYSCNKTLERIASLTRLTKERVRQIAEKLDKRLIQSTQCDADSITVAGAIYHYYKSLSSNSKNSLSKDAIINDVRNVWEWKESVSGFIEHFLEICIDSKISSEQKTKQVQEQSQETFVLNIDDVLLESLETSVYVPPSSYNAFLSNLKYDLPRGEFQKIAILFQKKIYSALLYNLKNSLRLRFCWTDTALPKAISKLNISTSDTLVMSCGNKSGQFKLDFKRKVNEGSQAPSAVVVFAPHAEKTPSCLTIENNVEVPPCNTSSQKELGAVSQEEKSLKSDGLMAKQGDFENVSDELLLETVFNLMYREKLFTDEVFRKLQTTYYCLRNFGTMEPVIQRLYPFMNPSDYNTHYNLWISPQDGIRYLILQKCNGLKRTELLQWAEKQKLNPEDLCKELHCSREVLGISMPQPAVTTTMETSQVIPESKDIVAGKEILETEEKDTQISWTDGETEVSEEDNSFSGKCGSILNQSFVRGFILNSPISNKRFRSFWENMYGEECSYSDESIQQTMKAIGVEFDGRIYAPAQLASPDVFEEIKQYIEQLFNDGKPVIYYQALFDEFSKRHVDWKINSPEMLKSFLAAQACPYPLLRSCLAKSRNVDVSPASEIREYLKEQQEPVNYDKLQSALPHIPLDVIKHELATNTEFVNAARGEYMHADIVDLSSDDLDVIANMIQTEIHSKGFMTGTELWEKLEIEHPEYTVRYSHLPLIGFRDALKHKFVGRFNFKGNIISSVEEPIGMADIFAGFCSRRESFHLQDIEQLCDDAGILAPGPYLDAVYENSIRISQDDFVSLNSISFDVQATDDAIARFCTGDFIAITEITSFAAFPSIGVPWTSFLVESFVFKYSKKFKLYHNQFSAKVCAGAIVRNEAKLFDYHQVLASVIAKSDCRLASEEALDYLCNAGFLGRRRYSEIDIVLSEARQLRSQKG